MIRKALAVLLACATSSIGFAQKADVTVPQVVATSEQVQVGIPAVALTESEYVFDTAEQHKIRAVVVAKGLKQGFAIALLPSGDALVSERSGSLRIVHNAMGGVGKISALDPVPIGGLPTVEPYYYGSGLHDVILDPQFATNGLLYMTFNRPGTPPQTATNPSEHWLSRMSLLRARLAGNKLVDVKQLYIAAEPSYSGVSRVRFGKDGMLYVTTSAPFGHDAQNLDSVAGKILRLTADGKIPADNPFVGRNDAKPEIFSYGHRDQFGLAVNPLTGMVLNAEHGIQGGDEINIIRPGRNYGWPKVSYGIEYDGSAITTSPVAAGIEDPIILWIPSIAPTSLVVYVGDRFPSWRGNLFVGSARRGQINQTGGLERIVLNDKMQELRRESLLTQLHHRVHFVTQGADGLLYVLTDNRDIEAAGTLIRIEPMPAPAP